MFCGLRQRGCFDKCSRVLAHPATVGTSAFPSVRLLTLNVIWISSISGERARISSVFCQGVHVYLSTQRPCTGFRYEARLLIPCERYCVFVAGMWARSLGV